MLLHAPHALVLTLISHPLAGGDHMSGTSNAACRPATIAALPLKHTVAILLWPRVRSEPVPCLYTSARGRRDAPSVAACLVHA